MPKTKFSKLRDDVSSFSWDWAELIFGTYQRRYSKFLVISSLNFRGLSSCFIE